MILNDEDPLDEFHSVVVQLIFNFLDLLGLMPELHKLICLLLVVFLYKLVQILNLLVQVLVDVHQFGFGHLKHCLPLGVQNLDLLLAEIKFFACLINFFL